MTLTRATTADVLSVTRRAARAAGGDGVPELAQADSAVNVTPPAAAGRSRETEHRHPDPQGTDGAVTHGIRAGRSGAEEPRSGSSTRGSS